MAYLAYLWLIYGLIMVLDPYGQIVAFSDPTPATIGISTRIVVGANGNHEKCCSSQNFVAQTISDGKTGNPRTKSGFAI